MWQKYKAAMITGGILCCIIFFGLGYCVGNSGKGYHGGIQPTLSQTTENGRQGGKHQWNLPGNDNTQAPSDKGAPDNGGIQTTPDAGGGTQTAPDTDNGTQATPDAGSGTQITPDTGNNTGNTGGASNMSSFFYGETYVF